MPDEPKPPEERPEEPEEKEETPEQRVIRERREARQTASARKNVDDERRRREQEEKEGSRRRQEGNEQEEERPRVEKRKSGPVPEEYLPLNQYLWSRVLGRALTEIEMEQAKYEWAPENTRINPSTEELSRLLSDLKKEEDFKRELEEGGSMRGYMIGAKIYIERAENPRFDQRAELKRISEGVDEKIKDITTNAKDYSELRASIIKYVSELTKEQDILRRRERQLAAPAGVRELALDIMYINGGEFGRGGRYALLEYTPEGEEIFRPGNFLRWVRDRMIYYHKADPDNPNINLNSQVNIFGNFRDIAIQQMIDNPAFFTDEQTGVYYEKLRDQVIYELWLFGQSRSIDAFYRQQMGSDVELPKMLLQIYQSNAFTKKGTLSRILTLMNVDKGSNVEEFYGDEEKNRTRPE